MLDQQVDDKGTDQAEAREIIKNLCDSASGAEPVDDDLVMKARGIAINRGVEVEQGEEQTNSQ